MLKFLINLVLFLSIFLVDGKFGFVAGVFWSVVVGIINLISFLEFLEKKELERCGRN